MLEEPFSNSVLNQIIDCYNNPNNIKKIDRINVGDVDLKSYISYVQVLKKHFTLEGNIIEFGCGTFPIMSYLIDYEQQQIAKGSITAYDPYLGVDSLGNINLQRKCFDFNEDISDCDLLFSIFPCDHTPELVQKANRDNLNLFIGPCGCPPFYDSQMIYDMAQKGLTTNAELFMEKSVPRMLPVIIRKKIK